MPATLPIPLSFRIPDGWVAAPADELGIGDVAFAMVHPASRTGFTAHITVSGQRRGDYASLREVADETFAPLRRAAAAAVIAKEIDTGGGTAPGLTRLAELRVEVDGCWRELTQCQVFVTVPDVNRPLDRVVLCFALTGEPEQTRSLAEDFEAFVASARPRPPEPD